MATRTADARKKWADALQADLGEIHELVEKACTLMREVEADTRGVNGLPSFLRSKGNELEQMAKDIRTELEDVPAKLSGEKTKKRTPSIVERLGTAEHLAAVGEARDVAGA